MTSAKCVFSRVVPVRKNRCRPHSHHCMEIVYSRGSAGTLYQGEDVLRYSNHTIFTYQPGPLHWIENTRPGEHICIGVVGCGADRVRAGLWKATPRLIHYFNEIRSDCQNPGKWQAPRSDLLSGLIVCDLLAQQSGKGTATSTPAQRVRDRIEAQLAAPLPLKTLAESIGTSPDYLRQLFRREFGESVRAYILRRRIELAELLLKSTSAPIKEIANQTGFQNEHYFSRLFHQRTGHTPTQFRAADTIA